MTLITFGACKCVFSLQSFLYSSLFCFS